MLKTIAICEKCKEKTFFFEDVGGVIVFDFEKKQITFLCAKCGFENAFNFSEIAEILQTKTAYPRINVR